ncbi:hypothetical protein C8F01DRAFT_1233281 [Mycena amicta]|nr:hypothetical protein C8F01DRAFT_1233281 [Mycena amicta]
MTCSDVSTPDLSQRASSVSTCLGPVASGGWLAHMILAAQVMASTTRFINIPYINAVFETTLVFLETVDQKVHRNRDALRDLCASIVEIVSTLSRELHASAHNASRFLSFCGEFIEILHALRNGLEQMGRRRKGIGGRVWEILNARNVAEELQRQRNRINDLRANFILIATVDVNLTVKSLVPPSNIEVEKSLFRNISLGDINLLYESPLSNNIHKIKVFTAKIAPESSLMTVAKYDDEDMWMHDMHRSSRLRHPNLCQLFGVTKAPLWHALIFHDEIIPLAVYRQFYRPVSDVIWVLTEAILFKEFKVWTAVLFSHLIIFQDAAQYHVWHFEHEGESVAEESAICVKLSPPRICLAIPQFQKDNFLVDCLELSLSEWHTPNFNTQVTPPSPIISTLLRAWTSTPTWPALIGNLKWPMVCNSLIPAWYMWPLNGVKPCEVFIGAGIQVQRGDPWPVTLIGESSPPSCLEVASKGWKLSRCSFPASLLIQHDAVGDTWTRITIPSGYFKASELSCPPTPTDGFSFVCGVKLPEEKRAEANTAWLTNNRQWVCESYPATASKDCACGVLQSLSCHVGFHPLEEEQELLQNGTTEVAYLFLCPVDVVSGESGRISLHLPESNQFYWSLNSSGGNPLDEEQIRRIGLPRMNFVFAFGASVWHKYHFGAIREFVGIDK